MPCTRTSMRTGPVRSSILSPAPTSLLGLAATPFTFTRPALTASAASARVFTSREAHSHLSTRMRSSEGFGGTPRLLRGAVHRLAHDLAVLELPDLAERRLELDPAALPSPAESVDDEDHIGRDLNEVGVVRVVLP